jgi:hypothetical protein
MSVIREGIDPCEKHVIGMLNTPPYGDLVREGDKIPDKANLELFNYCPVCGTASRDMKIILMTGRPVYLGDKDEHRNSR